MPVTETQAWREAAVTVPKDDVMLATLELHHPAFIEEGEQVAVRVVRNTVDLDLRLEVGAPLQSGQTVSWTAMPFEIDFPRIGAIGVECPLRLDNVGREVARYLAAATSLNAPLLVIFRGYLASDPDTVAQGPFRLQLRNVRRKGPSLTGSLVVASPGDLKFLRRVYDMVSFPALMAASAT